MFPTLLGITLVVFFIMAAAPGGITAQSLMGGQDLDPEERRALEVYYNKLYGLDQPAPVQYLRWLNNISPIGFVFDDDGDIDTFSFTKGIYLGVSTNYNRDVTTLLIERVPITLLLNILSIPIIYLIAIAIGVRAATKRGESFDVRSGMTMLGLWSIPTMLVGVLLIGFFSSDQYWHFFPTTGLSEREAHDMPFLPHWSNTVDIISFIFSMLVGVYLFVWLSRHSNIRLRAIIMSMTGALAGFAMAYSLPDAGIVAYVILLTIFTYLFYQLSDMDYPSFRTITMGLMGLCLGGAISVYFWQGEFIRGFIIDRAWHLILPLMCFTYGSFAFLSKLSRTAVLENLLSDYARTARAKGVSEHDVLWRHVFRNSLLPLITVSASLLPALLSGSVIVEQIFSIDGMGRLAIEAVNFRDRELLLSITLVSGILTLLGNLIADIGYAIADPRVSYD